jgi:hypothetical protein
MLRMAVGHSNDPDPADAASDVVRQCREQLDGLEPDVALLLATIDMDHQPLLDRIAEACPHTSLVGATTDGEFSSVLGYQEDSVSLAMFSSGTIDLSTGVGRNLSRDLQAACRQAVDQARSGTNQDPRLCFVLPDTRGVDPDSIVAALHGLLGPNVTILGGGSSATDPSNWRSYQFAGSERLEDSLAILLFSGPLELSTGVATGWKPLGKAGLITRAHENLVFEIDGEPAIEFFKRYVGTPSPALIATPLAVFESDSEDYYLRAPTAYDEESGSVTFFGSIPENARVRLSHSSTEDILDGASESFDLARAHYPESKRPEAALLVSCAVRKMLLGGRTGEEMSRFTAGIEPSLPVCGFYAYGEIGPLADDKTRFHNTTIVTLLLGT